MVWLWQQMMLWVETTIVRIYTRVNVFGRSPVDVRMLRHQCYWIWHQVHLMVMMLHRFTATRWPRRRSCCRSRWVICLIHLRVVCRWRDLTMMMENHSAVNRSICIDALESLVVHRHMNMRHELREPHVRPKNTKGKHKLTQVVYMALIHGFQISLLFQHNDCQSHCRQTGHMPASQRIPTKHRAKPVRVDWHNQIPGSRWRGYGKNNQEDSTILHTLVVVLCSAIQVFL